jgi:predicted  nucleic acid-binding Zn-ribbon protein
LSALTLEQALQHAAESARIERAHFEHGVKDLRGEDAQLRIEIASVHREVGIEREITRSMVAAVDARMDETNRQLARLASALERLGSRG